MKVVVSDLDGTLLHSRNKISEKTISTIKKLVDGGIEFVIATGRGKEGIKFILDELGFVPYLIGNNGATIYDRNQNLIYEKTIPQHIAVEIIKEIKNNNLIYNGFYNEFFYHSKEDKNLYLERKEFTKVILDREEDITEVNKIIVNEEPEKIKKIAKIIRDKFKEYAEITISQPECLDIVPKGCSKGESIKRLSEILGIEIEKFMAFGDGENDIDMLRNVGCPVIMENSQEILKKEFRTLTKRCDEDGVAFYLERYFSL